MTPLKLAKIKTCQKCEHRKVDASWRWPRCMQANRGAELSDLFFEGEASECAIGRFDGLNPEDIVEAEVLKSIHAAQKRAALVAEYDGALPAGHTSGVDLEPTPYYDWRQEGIAFRKEQCDACTGIVDIVDSITGKPEPAPCNLKQCKSCRKNALLSRPGMVCPATPPQWRPMQKSLKAIWVVSAWNEELVGFTVDQMKGSIADPHIEFDVIVVDDGSIDGSCDNLGCQVIRNEEPLGIGYNLNIGTAEALKRGADVVGVADSHMKFPRGVIDALVRRAVEEPCILCSASYGWETESKMRQWGAYFVKMKENNIAARWVGGKWPLLPGEKFHHPAEPWAQVQIPLGACYAYSRETIAAMRKPTGRLWETVVGRWGFLLEPFSAKAWLLDIPVYTSRDHYARHYYRGSNPLPQAHVHKVRNIAFGTASVFHPETWAKHFEHWCKSRGGITPPEIDALAAEARKGVVRTWTVEDEEALMNSMPDEPLEKDKKTAIPLNKILLKSRRDKKMKSKNARKKEATPCGK